MASVNSALDLADSNRNVAHTNKSLARLSFPIAFVAYSLWTIYTQKSCRVVVLLLTLVKYSTISINTRPNSISTQSKT